MTTLTYFSPHRTDNPARSRGCLTCTHNHGRFYAADLLCERDGARKVMGVPNDGVLPLGGVTMNRGSIVLALLCLIANASALAIDFGDVQLHDGRGNGMAFAVAMKKDDVSFSDSVRFTSEEGDRRVVVSSVYGNCDVSHVPYWKVDVLDVRMLDAAGNEVGAWKEDLEDRDRPERGKLRVWTNTGRLLAGQKYTLLVVGTALNHGCKPPVSLDLGAISAPGVNAWPEYLVQLQP